jgi:hypothetical protein
MLAASLSLALLQAPPATAPPPNTPPLEPAPATPPDSATQPTAPPPDAFAPLSGGQPSPTSPPPAYSPGYHANDPSPPPFVNRPPVATPRELPESTTHRRLVFQNTYALGFGLFYIPSGDFSFFLGSNLKPRKNLARTFDWNTAIGYQLTLSVGLADYPITSFSASNPDSIFFQRHHLTAVGYGGPNQRFYYSAGGGALMRGSTLVGLEIEGKLGGRFAVRKDSRVSGIAGGQFRLGASLDEGIPLPQFGLFLGFMVF